MTAGLNNFTIEQGTTFRRTFTWTAGGEPVDLTGAECRMQIRSAKSRTATLLADVTEYLTTNSLIGEIVLEVPGAVTDGYAFDSGHFSLRVDRPGDNRRLVEGTVTVSKETTV